MRQASRRKFHFIYQTTCKITGKYYRGMHSTDDMDDGYLGSGLRLSRSVKKHGKENHERVLLEDCSKQGRAFLREREKAWVGQEQLDDPLCMNLIKGGASMGHSDQTRQLIGDLQKGKKRPRTSEHQAKLNAALRAYGERQRALRALDPKPKQLHFRMCPTCQKQLSYVSKTVRDNLEKKGSSCKRCTKPKFSEAARQKMVENGKRTKFRTVTEETRRKQSESRRGKPNAFKGKHHTDDAKQRIGKSSSERLFAKKKPGMKLYRFSAIECSSDPACDTILTGEDGSKLHGQSYLGSAGTPC